MKKQSLKETIDGLGADAQIELITSIIGVFYQRFALDEEARIAAVIHRVMAFKIQSSLFGDSPIDVYVRILITKEADAIQPVVDSIELKRTMTKIGEAKEETELVRITGPLIAAGMSYLMYLNEEDEVIEDEAD